MKVIEGNSINALTYVVLEEFLKNEDKIFANHRTGRETIDIGPVTMILTDPRRRYLTLPKRGANPIATIAEAIWVLSGRDDIGWLSHYLPRASDFSDDGSTWRAGYGPRLRFLSVESEDHREFTMIDQVEKVIAELKVDSTSRQAVIPIIQPYDLIARGNTVDFPCTQLLDFKIRDGKLDLTIYMRSNDVVWGFTAINGFEFTLLQEIVASTLKIPLGKYYHVANSFHLYLRSAPQKQEMDMLTKAKAIVAAPRYDVYDYVHPKREPLDLETFDSDAERFFLSEKESRNTPQTAGPSWLNSHFMTDANFLIWAHNFLKRGIETNDEISIRKAFKFAGKVHETARPGALDYLWRTSRTAKIHNIAFPALEDALRPPPYSDPEIDGPYFESMRSFVFGENNT